MNNEQLFNWFTYILGIAFFVWLSLPIVSILFSVSEAVASFLPKKRYSNEEIDRIFGNNFSSSPPKNPAGKPKNAYRQNLNTSSSIREYSLPDGSKVAFDSSEVDVSERSAI
jgi:hypothetical protein